MGFGRSFLITRGDISVYKGESERLNWVSYALSGMYFRFAGRLIKGGGDETVMTLIVVSSSSERKIMRDVRRRDEVCRAHTQTGPTNQSTIDSTLQLRYLRDSS